MSTSAIIVLVNYKNSDLIYLEKTHDGFLDVFERDMEYAKNSCSDIEEIANYLVNHCNYDIALYSHKYPHYAFVYIEDKNKIIEVEIDSGITKIAECMPDVEEEIKKYFCED